PKREPSELWSIELGSVVFATPTLAKDARGRLTAYVGTHEGRFVGVVVEGADAGTVSFDVALGGRIWATAAAVQTKTPEGGEALRLYIGNDDDTLFALEPATKPDPIAWRLRLG